MQNNLTALPQLSKNAQTELNQVGSWSKSQNLRYVVFLYKNKKLLSRKKRSNQRFFQQMSKSVNTRTSIQCRCHHQKIFSRFKSLQKIISYYRRIFKLKNEVVFNQYIEKIAEDKALNEIRQGIKVKEDNLQLQNFQEEHLNNSIQFRQLSQCNFDKNSYQHVLTECPNPYMWIYYWNEWFQGPLFVPYYIDI